MPTKYSDRISALREMMAERGWDAVAIFGTDPHASEYPAPRWKQVEWLTGFTGSAGTAVVTQKEALLWTDSRYWLQAEEQLSGTEFRLMKDGEDVDISDWLSAHCENVRWSYNAPFDEIWKDRPSLPATKAWVMPEDVVGEGAESKLNRLVDYLRTNNQAGIYVSDLSEVAWLLNVRASDIDYNPYVIAFLYVSADGKHRMYVNKEQVEDIKDYLSALNISVEPYDEDITRFCDKTPITEWK